MNLGFRNLLTAALLGPGVDNIEAQGPGRVWYLVKRAWNEPSFGILRLVRLGLLLSLFLFPTIYIDWVVASTRRSVVALSRELYYGAALIFLLTALFRDWHESGFIAYVTIYLLAGVLCHLAGQVLAWRDQSVDRERSVVLSIMNYFETAVAFAILYRHWNCLSWNCLSLKHPSAIEALYFSMVNWNYGGIRRHSAEWCAWADIGYESAGNLFSLCGRIH